MVATNQKLLASGIGKAEADCDLFGAGSLTVLQVTAQYGIGRSEVYRMMRDHEIRWAQINKRRLIPRSEIVRYLRSKLVSPPAIESPTVAEPLSALAVA